MNLELNNSNMKKLIKLIIITVLVVFCVFRFDKIYACGTWIIGLLMPFVIGFAIAFILNVPMKGFENLLFRNEKSRWYRFRRPVCMVLSLICVVLVIAFVITMLIPEVSRTITAIGQQFPSTMEAIKNWAVNLTAGYPDIVDRIMEIDIAWDKVSESAINLIKNGSGSLLSSTFNFATSVVSGIIDFVVGLFFAIYILAQKENLKRQTKGLIYALFKEKTADKIIKTCVMADETFANFITGQCLEACILGLMFFVSMSVLSIPYALTVSVTIVVTALIPVFGAFIGCGVGAFLILVDDPKKVLVFLILFIILQQIEGNLIYPHVVGGSVGLPSIWVLVAVIIGGDLMGILGMLIFVPLSSVLYALVKEFVLMRLREKGVAWEKYGEPYASSDDDWREKPRKRQQRRQSRRMKEKRSKENA